MDNKIFITMNIAKEDMVRNKFLNLNSWKSNGPLSKEALLKLVVGTNTLICTPTDDVGMDVLNAAGPSLQAICTISPTTDHIDVNECRKRNVAVVDMPYATVDNAYDLTLNILERLNAHQLMIRPSLQAICTISPTTDHIDVNECRKRNVAVVNMPYASVDNAYDLTLNILERLNAHQLMIRSPDVSPSKTYSETLCPVCFDRERNVAFQCSHSVPRTGAVIGGFV
ncbi:uncharacterized protein LOC128245634 isoform X1 [Mya arenaria]|uniref:uncharacterized protein LOC128245634 isoform X1 n=1 Tax=Mya arenaria TaxID=6604 RepID=UPI0022E84049|nr:uncharacterized protein LOC128245634 isoform X1 [Mya arenaria]